MSEDQDDTQPELLFTDEELDAMLECNHAKAQKIFAYMGNFTGDSIVFCGDHVPTTHWCPECGSLMMDGFWIIPGANTMCVEVEH